MYAESEWLNCAVSEGPPPLWNVGPDVVARVQVEYNGDRTEAIWTLEGSINGVDFHPFAPTVTLTDPGMTAKVDVAGVRVLRLNLSTLETTNTALNARFFIFSQDTDAS